MRALSREVVGDIAEARRAASAGRRPWSPGDPGREALGRVAASGEWLAIPHIISMVLDRHAAVVDAASDAVRTLQRAVPVRDLPRLDRSFRQMPGLSWDGRDAWRSLTPRGLDQLANLAAGPSLLQLATMHPGGHVREAALRRTSVCSDGGEAPYYLLRINDWVVEVRRAAASALRTRLRAACATELMATLPLLEAARHWRRVDRPEVVAELEAFLVSPDAATALRAVLNAPDRRTRMAGFRRALRSPLAAAGVIEVGLGDRDATIRLWALRRLRDQGGVEVERFLEALLGDPLGAIRAEAVQVALDRGLAVDLAPFLCDAHAGARSVAQAAMLVADADVLAHYREVVARGAGRLLAAAVRGLAETGNAADAPAIRPRLDDDRARVREAALNSLAILDVDDLEAVCLRALGDRSASVSRLARDLLLRRAPRMRPAQVWQAYEAIDTELGRVHALAVLGQLDFWTRLPYLLRATRGLDDTVRGRALCETRRWLSRVNACFTAPGHAEVEAIRDALGGAHLEPVLRVEIDAVLRCRIV